MIGIVVTLKKELAEERRKRAAAEAEADELRAAKRRCP